MKDELTRLRKIVDRDPKSTMFVPLAEEYRKQGRLEEATETLKRGLMVQPLYSTGRVALGKVLMEREMLQEAREEFERVVDAMPENIAARKKLAEIYSRLGRTDLADEHSRVVSGLTPPPLPKRLPEGGADADVSEPDIDAEVPEDVIEIATESMADVYISQNLYDKAMDVLLKLVKQSPDNKGMQQKIEDLRMLINISKRGG